MGRVIQIRGVGDDRQFQIDGHNSFVPSSVFIHCGSFSVELDRMSLLSALKMELGLEDPLEMMFERVYQEG